MLELIKKYYLILIFIILSFLSGYLLGSNTTLKDFSGKLGVAVDFYEEDTVKNTKEKVGLDVDLYKNNDRNQ